MAQIAAPFDSGAGATVNEATFQKMARAYLSTGVLAGRLGQLAVTAPGSSMQVSVGTGQAQVEGFFYENDSALAMTIGAANATNPRIDTIVVRLDRTANTGLLAVVAGTPAGAPGVPTLSATDTLFELPLANVLVPAAAGVIVAGNVTDRRVLARNLVEGAAARRSRTAAAGTTAALTTAGPSFVNFNVVDEDTDSMAAANEIDLVCRRAGLFRVKAQVGITGGSPSVGGSLRSVGIRVNNILRSSSQAVAVTTTATLVATDRLIRLAVGDTVSVVAGGDGPADTMTVVPGPETTFFEVHWQRT